MKRLPWPFICLIVGGIVAIWQMAQPVAASGANGCITIGEVGAVSVAHCVDIDNDRELYVSSNGFVVVVED